MTHQTDHHTQKEHTNYYSCKTKLGSLNDSFRFYTTLFKPHAITDSVHYNTVTGVSMFITITVILNDLYDEVEVL